MGDEEPEEIPQDNRLRLRSDVGIDEEDVACERPPDSPVDRRPLAARSARESQGAMDGEGPPRASPKHSPSRPRPRQMHR